MRWIGLALILAFAAAAFGQSVAPNRRLNFQSATGGGSPPACTDPPNPYVWLKAQTNDTTARNTFRLDPAFALSSNVLYVAFAVNTKATAPDAVSAVTNGSGVVFSSVCATQFNNSAFGRVNCFAFMTNVDVASASYSFGFPANQTGFNGGILAISNTACGDVGADYLAAIVQSVMSTNVNATPSNHLAALGSTSNIVVVAYGNSANPATITPGENRSEFLDIGHNSPTMGLEICADTNNPVSDNTANSTSGGSAMWGSIGLEIKARVVSKPGIRLQPVSLSVSTNQNATFSTYGIGACTVSYQWGRTNLSNGYTNIPSATSSSYTLSNCSTNDSGATFVCWLTNSYGSATTAVATLTVSAGGGSIIKFVQGGITNGGAGVFTVLTKAFPANVTAGNAIVVAVQNGLDGVSMTITDTLANVYTPVTNRTWGGTPTQFQISVATNIAGGANTVFVRYSHDDPFLSMSIHEYTNVLTYAPVDVYAATNGVTPSANYGMNFKLTPTVNGDLIFGAFNWGSGNVTAGGGFTNRFNDGHITEDTTQVTAAQILVTATNDTSGSDFVGVGVALKAK